MKCCMNSSNKSCCLHILQNLQRLEKDRISTEIQKAWNMHRELIAMMMNLEICMSVLVLMV
jgi:hypothetical protein